MRRRHGPPRICMIVHGPYPVGEPRVAREVAAATAAGYRVDVVAMRRPGEPGSELVDGACVLRLPLSHRRGGGLLQLVAEYVGFTARASATVAALAVRRRYAVVQVHSPPDFLIAAAIVPKLLGGRVVLDIHDLSPDMFAMRFDGGAAAPLAERALRLVERAAAAVADAVVTVHEPYRRELQARGIRVAEVVMNALDERLLPPPLPGGTEGTADAFRIVYHGTVTPPYGVELAVEALAEMAGELPHARLEVYGEGDALAAVRTRAAALGVADRVKLAGVLPQHQVLERIRGASVGLVPNLPTRLNRFALSSKLFEYVALGIPVVAARLPTLEEHFSDEEVLFFEAADAGALAASLLDVARRPDAALTRAAAARRRYEQYRWPVSAARYTSLLARLVG